jgi:hypothetical protein
MFDTQTTQDTAYFNNLKKALDPKKHFNLKDFFFNKETQKFEMWKYCVGADDDIDMDVEEYTKDEFATLCGFSSRTTLDEAYQRYTALQNEAIFEKRMAND